MTITALGSAVRASFDARLQRPMIGKEKHSTNNSLRDVILGGQDGLVNMLGIALGVVAAGGSRHTFDSFECAIHKLAPVCDHCRCKIIGHGIEANKTFYCCANCARLAGVTEVRDHA